MLQLGFTSHTFPNRPRVH